MLLLYMWTLRRRKETGYEHFLLTSLVVMMNARLVSLAVGVSEHDGRITRISQAASSQLVAIEEAADLMRTSNEELDNGDAAYFVFCRCGLAFSSNN